MNKARPIGSLAAALFAAALLLVSLRLPLWHMRLEAPQYREEEALRIAVHPNSYRGDLREVRVLNQYIGVHVPPTLPQFKWLPALLAGGAAASFIAALLPQWARRRALVLVTGALLAGLVLAAVQAMSQMHDIGHKRDHKTILVGMKDFTPPFLGTTKIAQFTVTSRFGIGAWLIGGALALQLGGAWACKSRPRPSNKDPIQKSEIRNPKSEMPQGFLTSTLRSIATEDGSAATK